MQDLSDFSLVRQCYSWGFLKILWEKDKNEICFKRVSSAFLRAVSDFSSHGCSVDGWLVMLRFAVHNYVCF